MPVLITSLTTSSQVLSDGDTLSVTQFGSVSVANAAGISEFSANTGNVVVFGSVYGTTGIDLGGVFIGDAYNIHVGENGIVAGLGTTGSTGNGIDVIGSGTIITNLGEIFGTNRAIVGSGAITVQNEGSLTSPGLYAVSLVSSETGDPDTLNVDNSGTILGQSAGVFLRNGESTVNNSGTISGDSFGVSLFHTDARNEIIYASIVNSGTIDANIAIRASDTASSPFEPSINLSLVNTGLIAGVDASYQDNGGINDDITNRGTMTGTVALGTGFDDLTNSGTIEGDVTKGAGFLAMTNTGEINGTLVAQFVDGGFIVENLGLIAGTVFLPDNPSSSRFEGASGTVLGDIDGGDGNDIVYSGLGDDTVFGEGGNDMVDAGQGADSVDGGTGDDTFKGGIGDDTLRGEDNNDVLRGGDGYDLLNGGIDDDRLEGGTGDDTLIGDAGFDTLYGNGGDDVLDGGGRADLIVGGKGDDTLTGGGSADVFVIRRVGNGDDTVLDFQNGSDKVDISALGVQNFNALNNTFGALSQDTDSVIIDLAAAGGSGSIRLMGRTLADMDASDFIF